MNQFQFRSLPHISVILNKFIERRFTMMPQMLISVPSLGFVLSTSIVIGIAFLTLFYKKEMR